jgi:hypothetical protein
MTVLQASDYPKFRPIPRLHRRVVLTEKIDGSNGLIEVTKNENDYDNFTPLGDTNPGVAVSLWDEETQTHTRYLVRAGSRNRWLTPDNDNFGFARWVWGHAVELADLGEGHHYGEWFGKGIQVGYGLDEKKFALFNTARWYDPRDLGVTIEDYVRTFPKAQPAPEVVTVVPLLGVIDGKYLNEAVDEFLHILESQGSFIAPGFMRPEGVVVYHDAAGTYFKATIEGDEKPKSQAAK